MRYNMCKDQPAQVDCRREDCKYQNKGQCSNESPAITLNINGKFTCWSFDKREMYVNVYQGKHFFYYKSLDEARLQADKERIDFNGTYKLVKI